jgi:putative ABC transport system permease protein
MRAVATLPQFLGRAHTDGMAVISYEALAGMDARGFSRYVWTRGDLSQAIEALAAAGDRHIAAQTAVGSVDGLSFLAVAWAFDFFVVIGAVLAAVAAAALFVAVEARRRANAVATALLMRMGLRSRALLATFLAELAALAVLAGSAGLFAGWLVLAAASRHLDPAPWLALPPVPVSLLELAGATALTAAVLVLAATAVALRSARRAPVHALLRS